MVPAIVCLDLRTDMKTGRTEVTRVWTYRTKLVLEIVTSVGGQGHVVKVEPDLPEPTADPTAFLAGPTDRLLVERRLASRGVKVDDAEQARLGREDIVDAVEEGIKVGDLEEGG